MYSSLTWDFTLHHWMPSLMDESNKCGVLGPKQIIQKSKLILKNHCFLYIGKGVNITFTKNIWIDMKSIQCEDVDAMN